MKCFKYVEHKKDVLYLKPDEKSISQCPLCFSLEIMEHDKYYVREQGIRELET